MQDEIAGDPVTGRRWIRRSLRKVQKALQDQDVWLCCETIRRLLRKRKITPKSNRKRLVPKAHPERDRQFQYLTSQKQAFAKLGWPILAVDSKKKELIGLFKNPGQLWGALPTDVYMHDFPNDALGRAVPYGVYDVQHNFGYVHLGQSADTAEFAVEALVSYWQLYGRLAFPTAPELLLLADGGGSNGYRTHLWKQQLQVQLVDPFDLTVTVCHYPPGASKWNPCDHRLFSQISQTWAGTPLTSFEIALDGIRATTTTTGLHVEATLVEKTYQKGLKVSEEEMRSLNVEPHEILPAWNYTIRPRRTGSNS